MIRVLALCGLFLVACGSAGPGDGIDPPPPPPPPPDFGAALVGNWIIVGSAAAVFFDFSSTATYVRGIIQPTSATEANVEIENGDFSADAANIHFRPHQWSCALSDPPYYFPYSVTAAALTLSDSTGAVVLVRNTAAATNGVLLTYGCFDQGVFTPMPLVPTGN